MTQLVSTEAEKKWNNKSNSHIALQVFKFMILNAILLVSSVIKQIVCSLASVCFFL